ncbi:MAG: hypothetical protein J1E99_07140 [Muribaculaceae bacterium]|nr:hypothetical protein [Muribaculaceae bacterium]
MTNNRHTLESDFLRILKVPFTYSYTQQRFDTMSFKTLFGVSNLLKEYGVETSGYSYSDKSLILKLDDPFIAQTKGGLIIVTKLDNEKVEYLSEGVAETMPYEEFQEVWTGVVLVGKVSPGAKEPEYGKHCREVFINDSKKALLWILAGLLTAYLLATNGTWRYWSVWALIAVDCFGLWLTFMLVQKSLKIKNHVADKVCGVLQEGGCDSILKTSASSFFGIFSWSEVGFTYFGVSLLALLISPHTIHWLALINICCLPFTVWSISYQKFVAKHWCTLCVCVQLSLWLQFFCYFFGKWEAPIFPLDLGFFALAATYVFVLLGLNRILPHFTNADGENE